jgi:integrator complex subunit 12
MEQTQIEAYLSSAVKLLHSSAPDSAEKLRKILEAEMLKNCNKSLSEKLTKKQMTDLLNQESKAVGSGFKLKKHKTKKIEDLKVATTPVINETQQQIIDNQSTSEDEDASSSAAMLLDDLTCQICRQMENTAGNPLLECTDCNQLYHSLCHSTKIPTSFDTSLFVCTICKSKKDKEGSSKSTKSYDSSASSASSSKDKEKEKVKEKEKLIKEKDREKQKSSSSDKKKSSESSSSSKSTSKKESITTSSRSRSGKK